MGPVVAPNERLPGSVIVHYQELALKGRNRPWFVASLVRSIRTSLADLDVARVQTLMGRIEVRLGPGADWDDVRTRLGGLPGIGNFSLATHVVPDLDAISDAVVAAVSGLPPRSFRIS